ncbi:histone h1 [Pyrenophora seminiperda CCB06]|uniref:Histone H1 n=1 Tax=Pyrenophora seminiperda CCB06 TaxID=1302712 RepID=A0A3M7M7W9_9PLEO|nr:histone h1 [Pyrenophora seminiperda CCB06]
MSIQKYIQANNKVDNLSDIAFRGHVNRAISSGEEKGDFARPKGSSGPVKLAKKEAKPAAAVTTKKAEPKAEKEKKTPTEKKTVEKKTTEKKAPTAKKATATKAKATTTTATTTKTAAASKKAVGRPKKATATTATAKATPAAKPKANASKPRKAAATPASAPAVEEEVSRVLGKTKSGRVTKTKAPTAASPKATKKGTCSKEGGPSGEEGYHT